MPGFVETRRTPSTPCRTAPCPARPCLAPPRHFHAVRRLTPAPTLPHGAPRCDKGRSMCHPGLGLRPFHRRAPVRPRARKVRTQTNKLCPVPWRFPGASSARRAGKEPFDTTAMQHPCIYRFDCFLMSVRSSISRPVREAVSPSNSAWTVRPSIRAFPRQAVRRASNRQAVKSAWTRQTVRRASIRQAVARALERRTVKPSFAASSRWRVRQAVVQVSLSPPPRAYARTRVCGGGGETRET
jgi:hypothetical protein